MDSGRKLSEAYQHYMDRHRGTKKTLQEYESYWRNHVGPALGDLPVRQIRPDDIRSLVDKLERLGRAPKTIHNVCGFLSQVLGHAVTMGWAPTSPYSAKLLPKNRAVKAERDHFLTIAEANTIINAMHTHGDAAR
ncbi:phage integrase central domain-containing protein [Nesterenkonia flava]|uniref:phage integrase central domain-containing protein n=1 Tax=Nesterenkonia flava TaxID=469799 RepID=UPI0031D33CE7